MESPSTKDQGTVAKTVWDSPSYLIRDDRFMITKKVPKVQVKQIKIHSKNVTCLSESCDAGEQTLAQPWRLVDYTEHDFAVRATLASTRLFL